MKTHDIKIELDKESFNAGDKVTGKVDIITNDQSWSEYGKVLVALYDKLDIRWIEDEVGVTSASKRAYSNFKKPFQVNQHEIFTRSGAILMQGDSNREEDVYLYEYKFEFELPKGLQGTLNVENAHNQYFIKAFLIHNETMELLYQQGMSIFDEIFKSLNPNSVKKEVIVHNQLAQYETTNQEQTFKAQSNRIKAIVKLPKLIYKRDETVPINLNIEHFEVDDERKLNFHKISFKIFQVLKLSANEPIERVRLFENLIAHSSRKSVHQNTKNGILIEEFIKIPNDIPSSTSRNVSDGTNRIQLNPIRVNYKLSIEFWKNFLFDELDINIPILVDPEA